VGVNAEMNSLCVDCSNGIKRRWRDKDGTEWSKIECTACYPRNVTFIVVMECSRFDKEKLTLSEFKDKFPERVK
jgi:hypothetical protein